MSSMQLQPRHANCISYVEVGIVERPINLWNASFTACACESFIPYSKALKYLSHTVIWLLVLYGIVEYMRQFKS